MAILQFAFGNDAHAADFKPHNYPRNLVVYTGTHDNDTTVGWWTGAAGHSTRSDSEIENEREHRPPLSGPRWARGALGVHPRGAGIGRGYGDRAGAGPLGLGSEARMNRPGTVSGNWRWRLEPGQLTRDDAQRLAVMTETYDRV